MSGQVYRALERGPALIPSAIEGAYANRDEAAVFLEDRFRRHAGVELAGEPVRLRERAP